MLHQEFSPLQQRATKQRVHSKVNPLVHVLKDTNQGYLRQFTKVKKFLNVTQHFMFEEIVPNYLNSISTGYNTMLF